jgi:hypothetical protein
MNRFLLVVALIVVALSSALVTGSNATLILRGVAEATPLNVGLTALIGLNTLAMAGLAFWYWPAGAAANASDKKPLPVDALLADACRLFVLQGEPGKAERLASLIQELAAGKPGGITKAE